MDIETARLFTEVVAHGGISEAARRNNLSQQTLSRRIIVLEEEVGAELLERSHRAEPTAAGRAFLSYAYDVLSLTSKMRSEVKKVQAGGTGRLRLKRYATESFFQIAARTVEGLERELPSLRVELVAKNEDDSSLVRDGFIDLGFSRVALHEGERVDDPVDGLERIPLKSNSFSLVFGAPEGHPILSVAAPTLADISRYRIATPSFASNGPIPKATEALFAREGLELRIDMVMCTSMLEYYAFAKGESLVVFNEAFAAESVSTPHRRFVPVMPADGPFLVGARLVYDPANANPFLSRAVNAVLAADAALAEGC